MREKGYCCPDGHGTANNFLSQFLVFSSSNPIKIDGSDVAPQVVHHVPIEAESWMSALFSFLFV